MAGTVYRQMRSIQDHSACFLLRGCFPIYPTTSIMTVLLRRSRPWNVLSVVWMRLWPDALGHLFWNRGLFPERRSRRPRRNQRRTPKLSIWLSGQTYGICFQNMIRRTCEEHKGKSVPIRPLRMRSLKFTSPGTSTWVRVFLSQFIASGNINKHYIFITKHQRDLISSTFPRGKPFLENSSFKKNKRPFLVMLFQSWEQPPLGLQGITAHPLGIL